MSRNKVQKFIRDHLFYNGDDCVVWPFARSIYGYGFYKDGQKMSYAHQWICKQIHGPRPSARHHAAHDCGNGAIGCINPTHIRWKTVEENMQDKTNFGTCGQKLTRAQVREIRRCGNTETQLALAARFKVTPSNIRKILNHETWKNLSQ